jgi:FeoB-associated Cys-rich membrane protein
MRYTMDWQLAAVWLLVAAAGLHVLRTLWKSLRGAGKGCGSGCGKCAPPDTNKPGRIALTQVKDK